MSKLPFFPLYVDDFLSSSKVELMPPDGVGGYILLLCRAWREIPPGSLPNDDRILCRWARVSESRWQELKPTVMAAFTSGDDSRWHQPRMRDEHAKAKKLYNGRRKGALNAAQQKRCNGSSATAQHSAQQVPSDTRQSDSGSKSPLLRSNKELPTDGVETAQQALVIYDTYPRKAAKPAALKAIGKALKKIPYAELLQKVQEYAQSVVGKDPEFIPHPATWFNQERWADIATTPTERPYKRLSECDEELKKYLLDDTQP